MTYKQTNNTVATYGEKSNSVADLQKKLNTMGANLSVDSMYGPKTQEAYNKYMGTSGGTTTTSPIETPTPINNIKPGTNLNLPQPESANVYDTYASTYEQNRKRYETALSDRAKTLAEEKAREEKIRADKIKMTDPTTRATYGQEQRIQTGQLNQAESSLGNIESDINKRRALTNELEGLMNMSNAMLKRESGMPLSQKVVNGRVARTMTDISARAGVIEAVFSAIDGNISHSQTLIDNAQQTVKADWEDKKSYYKTLIDLSDQKILDLDEESKSIAEKELGLIENDMKKVEETADYLKGLMIDPETAQFMADAGVKLTDSISEINEKMGKQAQIKKIEDTKNTMVTEGYTYVPNPTNTSGLVPIEIGGKTMWFRKPPEDPEIDVVKLDNGNTVLVNKWGNVVNNLGGGEAPASIIRTVGGQPVTGYTLEAGDDPYFVAEQYGITMDDLKKLNPNVTNWNNLPVGATLNVPMDDNDAFTKLLEQTAGGKALTDTSIQKLDKGLTVLNQLGVLQANIQDVKTGPIVGYFKGANPWDTNAQTIKTSLNAIVPNLARGVYGEVGVLTDNDIRTYSKTIPNLQSTEEVRNAVLYITLDMIGKSIKNTLNVNAAAGRDVSGFVDIYTEMESAKNSILSQIPSAQVPGAFKQEDNWLNQFSTKSLSNKDFFNSLGNKTN